MAIFRPGVRQGALQASRQGTLGQFLGSHPQAQQQWNQAARQAQGPGMAGQPLGGRQSMLGNRNAAAMMNGPTLGQAAGGRPQPVRGRQPAGRGPTGAGPGGRPVPPTAQPPQPPGAQGMQPQPFDQSMGQVGGNMYGQGPGAGYGMSPFMGQRGTPGGDMLSPYGMQQAQMRGMFGGGMQGGGLQPQQPYMGGMNQGGYGFNPNQGGYGQQALNGLMGQVNPGMQSVLQSRLGGMQGYGGQDPTMRGGGAYQAAPPNPWAGQTGGPGAGGFPSMGQPKSQYGQGANYANPYGGGFV